MKEKRTNNQRSNEKEETYECMQYLTLIISFQALTSDWQCHQWSQCCQLWKELLALLWSQVMTSHFHLTIQTIYFSLKQIVNVNGTVRVLGMFYCFWK